MASLAWPWLLGLAFLPSVVVLVLWLAGEGPGDPVTVALCTALPIAGGAAIAGFVERFARVRVNGWLFYYWTEQACVDVHVKGLTNERWMAIPAGFRTLERTLSAEGNAITIRISSPLAAPPLMNRMGYRKALRKTVKSNFDQLAFRLRHRNKLVSRFAFRLHRVWLKTIEPEAASRS